MLPIPPASGTGVFYNTAAKIIRLHRKGCTNRPVYHIVVTQRCRAPKEQVIEQLGVYDPLANVHGERFISLNMERINYWLGYRSHLSKPAAQILGIAGVLPVHPKTYLERNRRVAALAAAEAEAAAKEALAEKQG